MERFETDVTADEQGVVHVHVGRPGARVHVAVGPPSSSGLFGEVLDQVYGSCWDNTFVRPPQGEPEVRDEM